jgi:hypothetical protein
MKSATTLEKVALELEGLPVPLEVKASIEGEEWVAALRWPLNPTQFGRERESHV